jgi:hypothetical protein
MDKLVECAPIAMSKAVLADAAREGDVRRQSAAWGHAPPERVVVGGRRGRLVPLPRCNN